MSFGSRSLSSLSEWSFDVEKHIPIPFQTTIHSPSPPPSPPSPLSLYSESVMVSANGRFRPPPRWDSFKNRILTDENAARQAEKFTMEERLSSSSSSCSSSSSFETATITPRTRKETLSSRYTKDFAYISELGRKCRVGMKSGILQGQQMIRNQMVEKTEKNAGAGVGRRKQENVESVDVPRFQGGLMAGCVRQAGPMWDLFQPAATDNVLDIGCGAGVSTAALASRVKQGSLVGLDINAALIEEASTRYAVRMENLTFVQHDCSRLDLKPEELMTWEGVWDWVLSNSTFHWILRDKDTRHTLFANIYRLLKPGGRLVFEIGGAGHMPDAITALTAAMAMYGVPSETRRDANLWFFPTAEWMREALEGAGFDVLECELHYRPTKVSLYDGSLQALVRQLGSSFLDVVAPGEGTKKREEVVKWVCDVLNDSLERKEDGTRWLTSVRLRVLARKAVSSSASTYRTDRTEPAWATVNMSPFVHTCS